MLFKKVLIIFLTLVTAFSIIGCSQQKKDTNSVPKVKVDFQTAQDTAVKETPNIRDYFVNDSSEDYRLSSVKLLGNAPTSLYSLENGNSIQLDVDTPVYEVSFTKDNTDADFQLYIDANTGKTLGVNKKAS